MLDYFYSGGPLFMGLLSILFFLLIYSAIKNQSLIKGFGQLALACGVLGFLLGLFDAFKAVEASGARPKHLGRWTKKYPLACTLRPHHLHHCAFD